METIFDYRTMFFAMALALSTSCAVERPNPGESAREYAVLQIQEDSATLYKEYPATLQGIQTVEIRSKIAGYIEKIHVDEGAHVRKGQTLFTLDAKDIQAQVRSSEAQVTVAEAAVNNARINFNKTKPLVEKNIVSSFNLESAEASLQSAEAQLAQAKANLANAEATLEYTIISSPTEGIIGNFPYRAGSLVSSAITQPLTSISNTSSMYAYFSMNEKEFLSLTKDRKGKNLQEKLSYIPEVALILADHTLYKNTGRIETASGLVDQQTGSVNIRATFPNTDGLLQSGSSGKVRLPQHITNAILIPQKAAYELQGKHFVYVVGQDNKVKNTEVEVLASNLKDLYVVTNGLKAGDRIVIEGIATLQNDTPIQPKLTGTDKPEQSSLPENKN
ncbi:MAG: efflux RND transporter periplasmic adaptor subunit [Mangrovibacterium sp.]